MRNFVLIKNLLKKYTALEYHPEQNIFMTNEMFSAAEVKHFYTLSNTIESFFFSAELSAIKKTIVLSSRFLDNEGNTVR